MHDLKKIRENPKGFDEEIKKRFEIPIAKKILELDKNYRELLTNTQKLQEKRNDKSEKISKLANKDSKQIQFLKQEVVDIKNKMQQLDANLKVAEDDLNSLLMSLPNIPMNDVPIGKDEKSNQKIREWGNKPNFSFDPKEHFELGENLQMMDFEVASRMSGARFVVQKSDLAKMERAIANFMLDMHTSEFGYEEVSVPILVKTGTMQGTGQLPKFEKDQFLTTTGLWLIPTAEVPLTNMVREQIFDSSKLPLRYVSYTPCFRAEAGAAGRDTRGMLRQHQFYKVELVSIISSDKSNNELERMTSCAEEVLKRLNLPYQVVLLSSGDMGFAARKTYDIEVWLPGQNQYREISSCSNCGDFQARRMKARYKDVNQKGNEFPHTLNGSGLAVGRTLVAILENYQQEDGSIAIPDALQKYMDNKKYITINKT
tara:strand:- start:30 stop:1313 length:1284 start_codon:yes stop_codon:yes gene_type:complete